MNEIVRTAPSRQQDGMLRILLSDFSPNPGEYPLDTAMLCEMLSGQPEFDTAELFEDEIVMQMNPKYLPAEKKNIARSVRNRRTLCAPNTPCG